MTIGPAGGVVEHPAGARIEIQAGSFSVPVRVKIAKAPPRVSGPTAATETFEFDVVPQITSGSVASTAARAAGSNEADATGAFTVVLNLSVPIERIDQVVVANVRAGTERFFYPIDLGLRNAGRAISASLKTGGQFVHEQFYAVYTLLTDCSDQYELLPVLQGNGFPSDPNADPAMPVIFVHGWQAFPWNCIGWKALKVTPLDPRLLGDQVFAHLTDWGLESRLQYWVYTYPTFLSVSEAAKDFAARIEGRFPGRNDIVLIAHSMGGLVARSAIAQHGGGAHVQRVVTLGTPHTGTKAADPAFWTTDVPLSRMTKDDVVRLLYGTVIPPLDVEAVITRTLDQLWPYPLHTQGLKDLRPGSAAGGDFIRNLNAVPNENQELYHTFAGSLKAADVRWESYECAAGLACIAILLPWAFLEQTGNGPSDGIVPLSSAHLPKSKREDAYGTGYHHFEMRSGNTRDGAPLADDALLSRVAELVAEVLPPAGTVVWNGGGGNGLWSDPRNWDLGRVPGPSDIAQISAEAAAITLDVNATVLALEVTGSGAQLIHKANTLTIDSSATVGRSATYALGRRDALMSGTLTGAGDVNVQGTFEWSGGRQTGTGRTTLVSGAVVTWNGAADKDLDGRVLVNDATIAWSAGDFVLWNAANFINNGELRWIGAAGTHAIDDGLGAIGTVTNNGLFRNTTASTLQVYVTFNNDGSVAAESGTIHFIRGGTHSGSFTVARGAQLVFAWTTSYAPATHIFTGSVAGLGSVELGHPIRFEAGSRCDVSELIVSRETTRISGDLGIADSIWVHAGVLELETPATAVVVPQLKIGGSLGSGVIRGSDSLIVTNRFVWTRGAIAGPGVTWIRNTATSSWPASPKTHEGGVLVNDATIDWPLGTVTFSNGATLLNRGVIDQTATQPTGFAAGTGGGALRNEGTLRKSRTGAMSIAVPFDNRGVVDVIVGTVSVLGDYTPESSSALAIGLAGTTPGTQYGRLTVQDSAKLAGTLTVSLVGGFTPALNDEFTVLTFGAVSGDFATVNLPPLPQGLAWDRRFTATSMVLVIIPG